MARGLDLRRWAAVALVAAACGGAPPRAAPPASELEALELELKDDPTDLRAHLALARSFDRSGLPGGARRHYAIVHRNGALDGERDRARFSALLLERAQARIALGDPGAVADVERARRLGAAGTELQAASREAAFLAALAAYRRGDAASLARGDRLVAAAAAATGDPRGAAARPETAPLPRLARAAAWLDGGGARRAALARYGSYVRRGGRDPAHLSAYARLHRWWHGERRGLEAAVVAAILASGAETCLAAGQLGEPGCTAAELAEVARDPARALAVARRAARLGWRTGDADAAASVAILALRRWLAGDTDGWGADLRAVVDLEAACADAAALPAFAAATLLRTAGRSDAAAAALDRALTRPPADPVERAVVLVEAAVQGRSAPLLAGDGGDPLLAAARARVRAAGADPSPFSSPRAAARWYHAVAEVPGRDRLAARWGVDPGRAPELPLSLVDAARLADRATPGASPGDTELAAALAAIAGAFRRDPALADRRARRFADGGVLGERAPALVFLFRELGDADRSLAWAEELVARSPEHAPYLMWASEAAAAAGEPERAQIYAARGAAASGDAGAALGSAAASFLDAGEPVYALGAARQALALTAAGEAQEILSVVADAARVLGRDALAADARRQLPAFARRGAAAGGDAEALAAACAADPTDAAAAIAYLRAAPQAASVAAARAAAWNPRHVELLAAAAEHLPEPAASEWLLRAAAAAAETESGFVALAAAAEARGRTELAAAARARATRAPVAPAAP